MADTRFQPQSARSDDRGRPSRSNPWPLIAICAGYFMIILDTTVVSVALPSLSRELGVSTTELQWIVDAYSLVFAALLLSAGALADRRGARAVFIMGTGLFIVASAAGGLAASAGMLVAARCVQGAGAALAVPASLALLRAAYPGQRAQRRAFGIWGGVAGVAAGAGPVLGGALVSTVGWRSVFFVNVPIGILGLLLSCRRWRCAVGSTASKSVMTKPGPHTPMLAELLTKAVGLFGLMAAGPHGPYWILVVPFVAAGLGMSFTMPAATAAVMEAAPAERAGLASGTLNAARQVGGVIGVALLGTLVADHARFVSGLRVGMAIAGCAFAAGAVLIAVQRGRGDSR